MDSFGASRGRRKKRLGDLLIEGGLINDEHLLRRQLLYPAELLAHQLLTSVSLYIIPIYGIFVNTFLNFFHI